MKLTFQQAAAMVSVPDSCDNFPIPALNNDGFRAIQEWMSAHSRNGQHAVAWQEEAESEAVNLLSGYDGSIEMRGFYTRTGKPVTLTLSPDWFDWAINL